MTNYDHAFSRPMESSSAFASAAAAAASDVRPEMSPLLSTNSRTSIQFLTTPSSATADIPPIYGSNPSPGSVPVSALLSPPEPASQDYHISNPVSPASITPPRRAPLLSFNAAGVNSAGNGKYGDDELTGMEGLMELASPEHKSYNRIFEPARPPASYGSAGSRANRSHSSAAAVGSSGITLPPFSVISENNSSSTSSNSTNTYTAPPALSPPNGNHASTGNHASNNCSIGRNNHMSASTGGGNGANYAQSYHHQQHQHHPLHVTHHSANNMNSPTPAGMSLTPDSMSSGSAAHTGLKSFPATIDDMRTSRRRSQSTDGAYNANGQSSALPYLLGTANIRDRSLTGTQRQRTSDTPLFPILLYRIINDPQNEAWIRWCDEGAAFKFSSAEKLLACLQAAGLRAQNYHSIEKNLNDYRFVRLTDQRRKIPDPDGKLWWKFSHGQFHRDNPDVIVNILRRRRTNPTPVSPQPPIIPHQPPPPPSQHQHLQMQQQMQQRQHNLQSQSRYPHQNPDSWM